MARIIDVDEVQKALDRAARNALHGSRDVRAGRFVAGGASASPPTRSRLARAHTAAASPVEARNGTGKRTKTASR